MTNSDLEKLCAEAKVSSSDLPRIMSVNRSTVNRWFNGFSTIPTSVGLVLRLMIRYNITVAKIVAIMHEE